jgi:hypothetical protein
MENKSKNKTVKTKPKKVLKDKFLVFEFNIDKKYFPKKKGNNSKAYNKKQSIILRQLHDLELELIFSELKIQNIFKVIFDKKRQDSRPLNTSYLTDLNREILKFNTSYENYCLRVFIYREIISSFISCFLKLEVDKYWDVMKDSKIRDYKIYPVMNRFDSGNLKEMISYRNKLTHKIEFSDEKKNKEEDKKMELLKDLKSKNFKIKKSLNDILKIKKDLEKQILTQFDK